MYNLKKELKLYVSRFEENLRNFRWKILKRVENMISLYMNTPLYLSLSPFEHCLYYYDEHRSQTM